MLSKFLSLSLLTKIFISTLVVSLATFFMLAISLNNSFRSGLQEYFNQSELKEVRILAKKVSKVYSPDKGWNKLRHDHYKWYQLLEMIGEGSPPTIDMSIDAPAPPERDVIGGIMPPLLERVEDTSAKRDMPHKDLITTAFIPLSMRLNIIDLEGRLIEGRPENIQIANDNPDIKLSKIDILYQGKTVGFITVVQSVVVTAPLAEEFFNLQRTKMYFAIAVMFFVSFLIGAYLLKVYLSPLKKVEAAGKELMKGNFDYKIDINSKDELGSLSETYNALAKFLKREKAKRDQWITDIAHELRTPIQVLSSQVEAIQDGIRKPNEQTMNSISSQISVLGSLVEDLYTLSLTDEKANIVCDSSVDLMSLIETTLAAKEQQLTQKNIKVVRVYESGIPCTVEGDKESLIRVCANILENSIRYTDDGGEVRVTLSCNDSDVVIHFEDSSPGVPDESINKIFDRLYRVDQSRCRDKGGAGLGLSICKNIIGLHNGTITSSHSSLGGLKLTITIPLEKNPETIYETPKL